MIEYQQNLDLLRQYEQTDLFSVRVLALAESYGCDYNFARFYVQRTESGQMTAVLSYLDRDCFVLNGKCGPGRIDGLFCGHGIWYAALYSGFLHGSALQRGADDAVCAALRCAKRYGCV